MKLPEKIVLELTWKCPWACPCCMTPFSRTDGKIRGHEISVGEWKALAGEFMTNGVRHFNISGGDPFCKDGVCDLIRYIAAELKNSCGTSERAIKCLTTGENIDSGATALLRRTKTELILAFPGVASCNELSGGYSEFKDVLEKIHAFSSEGVLVSASCAAVSKNTDELEELARMAFLAGAEKTYFTPYGHTGRAAENQHLALTKAGELALGRAAAISERCIISQENTPAVDPTGMMRTNINSKERSVYWRDWKEL